MPSGRVANIVVKGLYRDSVQLMELTENVKRIEGVIDAAILMATKGNKEFLKSLGLLTPEGEAAEPNDVLIALKAETDLERLLKMVKDMLHKGGGPSVRRKSLDEAISEGADFAVISVPGRYVGEIASRFLEGGVNVFIFSDHVPVDVEVSLKNLGRMKGLLVLGPEAGTSLIGGFGLGFANSVRKGVVGIVASAGSGIQELTTILDVMGVGVSHALGVGGRDLTDEVGGIMTEECLKILDKDSGTRMICLLAKQSDKETVRRVLEDIRLGKPLLVTLLGEGRSSLGDITNIPTIHGLAMRICSMVSPSDYSRYAGMVREEAGRLRKAVAVEGYPRGFYCGGTLATETAYVWKWAGLEVATNMSLPWTRRLRDSRTSEHSTIVDYGDEEFTEGRPHPIIDPTLRNQRVVSEIRSDDTAAITMDLMIGYGAPENIILKTVEQIGEAVRSNPEKRVVVRVVGTPSDSQWHQVSLLESLPLIRVSSNALAAAYTASAGLGKPDVIEDVVEELIIVEG